MLGVRYDETLALSDMVRYRKNMTTITIPKREYKTLIEAKLRYDYLRRGFDDKDLFSPPSTQSAKEVIRTFAGTKKYSEEFLKSLEKGLKRSSHFRA